MDPYVMQVLSAIDDPSKVPTLGIRGCYTARVAHVVDGDTLDVIVISSGTNTVSKVRIRLAGIDTCELTSKDAHLAELARQARNTVMSLVNGTVCADLKTHAAFVTVDFGSGEKDKYGRHLANVFTANGINIGQYLKQQNLAYCYDGKKKPDNQSVTALLYNISQLNTWTNCALP
jgi:endonuclease YncB( thermonuclease family)